ncbi:MAG TPA: AAA family ATPase [Terriglobales bacterium]|nr:AAA family ATPase [Terriglobales bacterium]
MALKKVTLLTERVTDWNEYPFNIPAIASLRGIVVRKPMLFFVGENGSGKSTLLEAIAIHYGFGREGGNRNLRAETTESVRAVEPLVHALRVAFTVRTGAGFYLRAESFFNTATAIDALGVAGAYGGRSLHQQSHGESFISLAASKFNRDGFYVMDEPEAALSPQRQLSLLVILHDLLRNGRDVQVLIATHSPILLAYPEAQILSFDGGAIHEITYGESAPYQLCSSFLADPDRYVRALFDSDPRSPNARARPDPGHR